MNGAVGLIMLQRNAAILKNNSRWKLSHLLGISKHSEISWAIVWTTDQIRLSGSCWLNSSCETWYCLTNVDALNWENWRLMNTLYGLIGTTMQVENYLCSFINRSSTGTKVIVWNHVVYILTVFDDDALHQGSWSRVSLLAILLLVVSSMSQGNCRFLSESFC